MFDFMQLDWLGITYKPENYYKEAYELGFYPDIDNFDDVDEHSCKLPSVLELFFKRFPELEELYCSLRTANIHAPFDFKFLGNEKITVCYSEGRNIDQGLNVQVCSSALQYFFKQFGFDICDIDFKSFCELIYSRGCTFSRLDICFDDFEKKYTPSWYNWCANDEFDSHGNEIPNTSHMRTRMMRFDFVNKSTFYCGSRAKGKFMRIYDKSKESGSLIDAIRYEFELHSEYANAFIHHFFDTFENGKCQFNFSDYFFENWFVIIDRTSVNSSHCPINQEWYEYISALNPSVNSQFNAKVIVKVPQYSVEQLQYRSKVWFEKSCSNTLSLLAKSLGNEWLYNQLHKDIYWQYEHFIATHKENFDFEYFYEDLINSLTV